LLAATLIGATEDVATAATRCGAGIEADASLFELCPNTIGQSWNIASMTLAQIIHLRILYPPRHAPA
jgi:hypothetical protein